MVGEQTSQALRDSLKAAEDMVGWWDAEIARLQDKLKAATEARAACAKTADVIQQDAQSIGVVE